MPSLFNKPLIVTGLPGSGKTRIIKSLTQAYGITAEEKLFWQKSEVDQYFLVQVIDVRSPPESYPDWLIEEMGQRLLRANWIVWMFAEASDLETQAAWSRWLKGLGSNTSEVPRPIRCFYEVVPDPKTWPEPLKPQDSAQDNRLNNKAWQDESKPCAYQRITLPVGTVNLELLKMSLDNSIRSMGMRLLRAHGVLKTLEFDDWVALELTPNRLDTYHSLEQESAGRLTLEGFDLDREWFESLLIGCQIHS
jgi:GTPase SAR1 family protein